MSCKCPVCGRKTKSVGTLFLHLRNIRDFRHERWLDSYCTSNNINLMRITVKSIKNVKGANRPLTEALRRDFCT